MKFIDAPKYLPKDSYEAVIGEMVDRLSKQSGVISIYQIGHVSTPGISDIDLVAVFADNATCTMDPRETLSDDGRYLFIHNLFGVSRTDFSASRTYSFFHNYVHLWGEEIHESSAALNSDEQGALKRQLALEYLVKMYIGMTVEKTYKIIKLRSLMLQAKGLLYDCEFLGITSGPFIDATRRLVATREKWFQTQPRLDDIRAECLSLYDALAAFLDGTLKCDALFLPPSPPYRLSRNIRIHAGESLRYCHSGLNMPTRFAFLGRRYFNLQHRFNRFDFELPLKTQSIPAVIQKQFDWQRQMQQNNRDRFPHFMALSSSLTLS